MAESPSYQSNQSESKRDTKSAVTIQQVVIHYTAPDEHGNSKDFLVEIDAAKFGAVVWNVDDKKKFLKGKTLEEPALPGELPVPKPGKLLENRQDEDAGPSGTCCFINGRWICWD